MRRGSSTKRAPVSTTHVEPERLDLGAQPRGARAHARRERVEVDVVERQRDAGVAVLGQQLERVLDPVVGQAVGDVAEAQAHVTARFFAARRAIGHSAATPAAGTSEPGAGQQAGLERDQAEDAGADGALHARRRRVLDGVGVRAADDRGVRADEPERGDAAHGAARGG